MKPFNLEAALRGEKVVTRDGREVTQLVKFKGVIPPQTLMGVVEGVDVPHSWFSDGVKFALIQPDNLDLFMHEEPELAIWKPSACCSFRWLETQETFPRRVLQQLYVNKLKPEYEWRAVPTVTEEA